MGRRRDPRRPRGRRPRSTAPSSSTCSRPTTTTILEKFVGEEEITADELRSALRDATIANEVVPVLNGTAFKNKGVQPLLDAVVDYLPSPLDLPPVEGMNLKGDETLERKAERRRAVRRPGVQDHDRPPRRQAHLLPRLQRHARQGRPGAQRRARARRSASAACSRCTPTTARTSTPSSPATSSPASA